MEHHASGLAVLLTWLFGLARHPWGTFAHGEPLSVLERYDHLFISVLAALVTVALTLAVRFRLARIPGPFQQIMEFAVTFVRNLVSDNVEHQPDRYMPLIGTLGFFILLNNLFGLVPGLGSGTSNWNVTLGCALVVFLYYNFHGMREHGIGRYRGISPARYGSCGPSCGPWKCSACSPGSSATASGCSATSPASTWSRGSSSPWCPWWCRCP